MQPVSEPRTASGREDLPLSEEAAVTLTVNDRQLVTLLCTPRDLRELATGWLFAEGIIATPGEIVSLAGCAHDRELLITVSGALPEESSHWRLITSGCSGAVVGDGIVLDRVPRVSSRARFRLLALQARAREMRDAAVQYRRTGGLHGAALATSDRLLVLREDIGRHNAVDKVVGFALDQPVALGELALLATGRLSSEMVWKAARAGLPVAASLSIPSALARDMADAAGITLVGRMLSARPLVYTHPWRVSDSPAGEA